MCLPVESDGADLSISPHTCPKRPKPCSIKLHHRHTPRNQPRGPYSSSSAFFRSAVPSSGLRFGGDSGAASSLAATATINSLLPPRRPQAAIKEEERADEDANKLVELSSRESADDKPSRSSVRCRRLKNGKKDGRESNLSFPSLTRSRR